MSFLLTPEAMSFAMFVAVFALLMFGYPVGFTLMGTAMLFAGIGAARGIFDLHLLAALPLRVTGIMTNDLLQAIPLFLYLGVILQRTTLAADLLNGLGALFGRRAGGLAVATIVVSAMLAPTTGAIGTTVLTVGLMSLPTMLKANYDKRLASGVVCAAGTLGTVLPPSIVLILLGTTMQGAAIEAQLARGQLVTQPLTVEDIYLGSVGPVGVMLAAYLAYVVYVAWRHPERCPPPPGAEARPDYRRLAFTLFTPMALILFMLGLIISGLAYTVEAAATGAIGATIYAFARRQLNWKRLTETVQQVARLTSMVFLLLIGATTFSLVFRGFNGDLLVGRILAAVPGGSTGAVLAVMAVVFLLGFFLDAIEIIFLVVPIAMPPLLFLGADPVWLTVLTAINLQTAFLHPPFGLAILFVRSVAPPDVKTTDLYWGIIPFITISIAALILVWAAPGLVTALPSHVEMQRMVVAPASPGQMPPAPASDESPPSSADFAAPPAAKSH
jgi:tripartite ATP-independent transporter DctM subunit